MLIWSRDMNTEKQQVPKEVVHYTSLSTVLEKVLPTGNLRFSPMSKTNDPIETSDWSHTLLLDHWAKGEIVISQDSVSRIRKSEWKVLCMSMHHPEWLKKESYHGKPPRAFTDCARPAMWAHYGARHEGICLVFDGGRLNSAIQRANCGQVYRGRVRYIKDPEDLYENLQMPTSSIQERGDEEAARDFLRTNFKSIFLTKHIDWKPETEYRWLIHNPAEPDKYECVNFADSLLRVVAGSQVHESYKPSLLSLCQHYNADLWNVYWKGGDAHLKQWK